MLLGRSLRAWGFGAVGFGGGFAAMTGGTLLPSCVLLKSRSLSGLGPGEIGREGGGEEESGA